MKEYRTVLIDERSYIALVIDTITLRAESAWKLRCDSANLS